MNNIKYILPVMVSISSYQANASISDFYPDQVTLQQNGPGVCYNEHRPVTKREGEIFNSEIVAKMGTWQISSLESGWVIMGSGYSGEIKQGSASNTFCYPTSPSRSVTKYAPVYLEGGTAAQVQFNLVHDINSMIKPLSYLAHQMGFAWLGGNNGTYVGEDMSVWNDGRWRIRGNNDGSCSGYRCDEKTIITLDEFEYVMDNNSFQITGNIETTNKKLVKTIAVPAVNASSVEQAVVVTLQYDKSSDWSKTDTYGISESVTVGKTFKSPVVGGAGVETNVSFTIGADQSWANTSGGSEKETVSVQARTVVPANSELDVKVDLYKSTIAYPYEFAADVSYRFYFDGFVRYSGNGLKSHTEDRPTIGTSFVVGRIQENSDNLAYLWEHRNIDSETGKWDWQWMSNEHGSQVMANSLGRVLTPKKTKIRGNFIANNQFAGSVYFGEDTPYFASSNSRQKRDLSAVNSVTARSETQMADEIKAQMEEAGLENVSVNVSIQ